MIIDKSSWNLKELDILSLDNIPIDNLSNLKTNDEEQEFVRKESRIGSVCFLNKDKPEFVVKAKRRSKVINTVSSLVNPDGLLITKQEIRMNLDKDSSYTLDESQKFYKRKNDFDRKSKKKLTISTTLTIIEDIPEKSSLRKLFGFEESDDENIN